MYRFISDLIKILMRFEIEKGILFLKKSLRKIGIEKSKDNYKKD